MGLPVGDYELSTTVVPNGYTIPPSSSFLTATPGQTLTITVTVSSTNNRSGNGSGNESGNGGNGIGNGSDNGGNGGAGDGSGAGVGNGTANGSGATGGNGGNEATVTNLPNTGTSQQATATASDTNLLFAILLLAMTAAFGAWLYAGRRAKTQGGRSIS